VSSIKIIETKDGSHSLLNEALNETYHSTHGAIQESVHVFIKNGLHSWCNENNTTEVSVLEIGFGTGLNALLALKESMEKKIKIHFTTFEAFPVAEELISQLNYPQQINFSEANQLYQRLHQVEWNKPIAITADFVLEKRNEKIQDSTVSASNYDLIFFDAFAPAKQPEMWDSQVLEKVIRSLKQNGFFVTYCAQGQLKRNLKSLSMKVESLAGPPGKREMVRAIKLL
jgi:tRNA U34 5-methylaminomethyl-2-thiouridine-forming methyltransferase MnmC